jgi:hypothetical protein
MTPTDLRLWIDTRNVSDREAAKQLGCSRTSLRKWLAGKGPIPYYIALACSALAWGLPPWGTIAPPSQTQP